MTDTATMSLFDSRPNQHQRVLALLRSGPKTTGDFCAAYLGATFRTRISELRLWGWAEIRKDPIKGSSSFLYTMTWENETKTKPKKAKAA